VVWKPAAGTLARASKLANSIFLKSEARNLHLALVQLPHSWFDPANSAGSGAAELVTCLRSVLMKPEHQEWLDIIWYELTAATAEATGGSR
jgi:hypothetical protein